MRLRNAHAIYQGSNLDQVCRHSKSVETCEFRQVKRNTIATGVLPCRKTLSNCAIFSTEFRQVSHGGLGLLEDIDH